MTAGRLITRQTVTSRPKTKRLPINVDRQLKPVLATARVDGSPSRCLCPSSFLARFDASCVRADALQTDFSDPWLFDCAFQPAARTQTKFAMVSRRVTNPHRLASSSSLTVSSVAERANHFFKASEECSNFGTGPSLRVRPSNESTSKRQSSGSKRVDLSISPSSSTRPRVRPAP